ncbi:MAG: Deoxyguanosinetriphosphate triphosphohydrolase-like protein [Alphaproteobacteria bacterium MarineAlpha5_Bin12]|nr:deoxyguanosinetriphosphate triphosphohydrolase [Pelagibacteraceae bacterium]PPR41869.1 MAG: Deoxyguanosinetriphosphate triphosphohydrolase-like protein [Alphaproteobacteria bacterium MarineAlpha5_Bin12]|tara:strand:+ start:8811 stop:9938 length:1128 start_codon:yes stop_codon:yes gene_type:complete
MLKFLSSKPEFSKGRLYKEINDQPYRSHFQRDRDRIIHSTAFRKLKQKTQVFLENESDYYRTRLTHTLEVSQIARAISRNLDLNEDLCECIALAHDLGHPPFGHTGENILNYKMQNFNGFNHNEQTLRIITFLEKKYYDFNGLNLTWESLEGIIKHNGKIIDKVPFEINLYDKIHNLDIYKNPSLEAQIASIADDIAYNNHDIDDAIRADLITIEEISEINYFNEIIKQIKNRYSQIEKSILINEVIRFSIKLMVESIVEKTTENININNIKKIKDVNNYPSFLVTMDDQMNINSKQIKDFLFLKVYKNVKIEEKRKKNEIIIEKLFNHYQQNFNLLPNDWIKKSDTMNKERIICDYIAGMTDRYADLQYHLIYD